MDRLAANHREQHLSPGDAAVVRIDLEHVAIDQDQIRSLANIDRPADVLQLVDVGRAPGEGRYPGLERYALVGKP